MADATTLRVVKREEMRTLSDAGWRMDKRDKVYHIGIKAVVDNFPFDIDIVMQCGLVVPEGKVGQWFSARLSTDGECAPRCQGCESLAIMLELSE